MEIAGRYFLPRSARYVSARCAFADDAIRITGDDDTLLAEASKRAVRISQRLGTIPRRFEFADGGRFETDDNDSVDDALTGKRTFGEWVVDRLERSWHAVAVALVITVAAVYVAVVFGVPLAAQRMAAATPHSVETVLTDETLRTLDRLVLRPSKLDAVQIAKANAAFARVSALGKRGPAAYRLLIRDAPAIGPNAFALPDGTIVLSDQLMPLVMNDGELEGVFAHEIAHVDHRHQLQRVYEAAFVPALITFITGDVSQAGQYAVVLPGLLLDSSYTQSLEQQADDDAAVTLKRIGMAPSHLADLLERMEKTICGADGCLRSWLGTHPATEIRAAKLRQES